MKIAINLLPFRKKIAGAGKYAVKIIYELSGMDSKNDYFLYVTKAGKENFVISQPNFHFVYVKFNPQNILYRIFWEQMIFPLKLKSLKPDIIFTPSVAIPLLYKGNFYTTIHDLAYKKSVNKYGFIRKNYLKYATKIAVKKSNIIFTVSEFSKREIEKEFALKNREVLVTYNGVDEMFFNEFSSVEISNFKKKYNLPENFILYVGAIEPSKNIDKLLIGFSKFIKKCNLNYHLVLTSGIGWNSQYLIDLINDLKINDKIIFLPYILESELPKLYKGSKMLAYLSSYEGFGIPVLEAMAACIPIITSKSEAILEISNKTVISVKPENIDEIVDGMFKIISDKNLVNSLVARSKEKAKEYMWKNAAKVVYDQITADKIR